MRVSTKGRYALRIMTDLAMHREDGFIPLKEIAKRQGITLKYMEQIMPLLTRAGYMKSCRGNNGGYMLARDPGEYTAGQILRTTEGSLAPIPCVEETTNTCPHKDQCTTVSFWEGMWQVINDYVDRVTLEDLAEGRKIY